MYHRIIDPNDESRPNPALVSATPEVFERQMRHLAHRYRVVSAPEVLAAVDGGPPLPRRAVLITFDDAYRDFAEVAWPVLRRYGLPATLFVPTAYPDQPGRRFWWDRLAHAIATTERPALDGLPQGALSLDGEEARAPALRTVQAYMKAAPHAEAQAFLERLLASLGEPPFTDSPQVLGWDALRRLSHEGVTLAAHTRTHPALSRLPLSEARAEIRGSMDDLRREIGGVLPIFAYPFGDHDPAVVEVLRQEGVRLAFSIIEGHNRVPGTDRFRFRRTNVTPRTGASVLRVRLLSAGARLDRVRHARKRARAAAAASKAAPASATNGTAGLGHPAGGDAAQGATTPRPVAYVMSRFPKLTETFVLYEIAALEAKGVPVEVYPLLREHQARLHPEAQAWLNRAHFHPFLSKRILKAQLHFLREDAGLYLGLLADVLRRTWGSRNFFLGALGVFPKSVLFAYEMQKKGVRHLHAHFANHPAVAAFIVGRLTGIPYSFTAHGSDLHVERRMLDAKVDESAFAVTVSEYNRELMVETCGEHARGKIHVIHCGVSADVFGGSADGQHGRSRGGGFNLACVASFEPVKGHEHLIEACRILYDRGVDFRCHLIGEGPLRAQTEAAVRRAGLQDRIRFHGGLVRPEVVRLLSLMDAAVLASQPTANGKREGIPVALMEAMASGLPVVSSQLSGIPELVENGREGLLVPPADPEALAAALERLAGDPELRRRMGSAGREKVRRAFDLERSAEALLELLHAGGTDAANEAKDAPAQAQTEAQAQAQAPDGGAGAPREEPGAQRRRAHAEAPPEPPPEARL